MAYSASFMKDVHDLRRGSTGMKEFLFAASAKFDKKALSADSSLSWPVAGSNDPRRGEFFLGAARSTVERYDLHLYVEPVVENGIIRSLKVGRAIDEGHV